MQGLLRALSGGSVITPLCPCAELLLHEGRILQSPLAVFWDVTIPLNTSLAKGVLLLSGSGLLTPMFMFGDVSWGPRKPLEQCPGEPGLLGSSTAASLEAGEQLGTGGNTLLTEFEEGEELDHGLRRHF